MVARAALFFSNHGKPAGIRSPKRMMPDSGTLHQTGGVTVARRGRSDGPLASTNNKALCAGQTPEVNGFGPRSGSTTTGTPPNRPGRWAAAGRSTRTSTSRATMYQRPRHLAHNTARKTALDRSLQRATRKQSIWIKTKSDVRLGGSKRKGSDVREPALRIDPGKFHLWLRGKPF
jgi:hypothetical protein